MCSLENLTSKIERVALTAIHMKDKESGDFNEVGNVRSSVNRVSVTHIIALQ